MDDFTRSEIAYTELFNAEKTTLPPELLPSIIHLEIRDKLSLAKSLILFSSSQYEKQSSLLDGTTLLNGVGNQIKNLKGTSLIISHYGKSERERVAIFNELMEKLMIYLPCLRVLVPRNKDFVKDPSCIKATATFIRHLEINRTLLLAGPPHKSEYTINPGKAGEWVAAQKTEERRALAQILLERIRYISHDELLRALQICVEQASRKLTGAPVIFIVGSPKKSNYYISLLFAHFWLEADLPIDCVIEQFNKIDTLSLYGDFIDIDDMSYSGSQTISSHTGITKNLCGLIRDHIRKTFEHHENKAYRDAYNDTHMILPRFVFEKTLQQIGFRYILVRAFMSEYSHQLMKEDSVPRIPIDIVTSEVIQYLPGVDPEIRKKIMFLFNLDNVYTTVYFDHKVADVPSTYLHVISQGIVPEKALRHNVGVENRPYVNNVGGEGAEFIPFVNHCLETERILRRNNRNFSDLPDTSRCPPAWYKYINYDIGKYLPPFRGGKRKTKRKPKSKRTTRKKGRQSYR